MNQTQVYLGIGSNIDRKKNITGCLSALKKEYGQLAVSPVYESKAFGFEGSDFFNLVVGLKTESDIDALESRLREFEYQFGRKRHQSRYSSRTLDIDILLYGDLVCDKYHLPRADVVKFAFVLKPLCDIASELVHPVTGQTVSELWQGFNEPDQEIRQVQDLRLT